MKMRIALFAICAGTFALVQADMARAADGWTAHLNGDVGVHSNPAGLPITVGDCQKGGGKVVKRGAKFICAGSSNKAMPKGGMGNDQK